jgi:hypothetical protein
MADLTGSWLGTYWQANQPTRFEMTLVQAQNSLSGNILDDGHLGEAMVNGEVIGRSVRFTKRYISGSGHSIQYSGTVSEDETYIQGNWSIDKRHNGTWEARRNGEDLMESLRRRQAAQTPAVAGVGAT